ncbi:MAG: stage II sporulation protein D [Ruminococcaceae bacterium]|nr:stage II sporulation protein D [Oscillospiraceae bacterium]
MNIKILGIIVSIIAMLFSPTVAGLFMTGQADTSSEGLDKSNIEPKEIELYITSTGVKEELDFEEYVCCVLLGEVPATFDEEALKAMAVAVRSYCTRRMQTNDGYLKHYAADVCDDYTHCLGYISLEDAKKRWGDELANQYYDKIKNAVDQTKGEVLYYEGVVADTVFHSSSYGYTESAGNVWGADVPYLICVSSPEDANVSYAEYNSEEFRKILESEGVKCDLSIEPDGWLGETVKSEKGRTDRVYICGTAITGRRIREIFGLKSTCFDIIYNDGMFKFEVKGYGHGVGMSQYGCSVMASDGKKYTEILSHYYPQTELGLY